MLYVVTGGNKQQRKVVDTAMSYVVQLLNIPSNVFIDIELSKMDIKGAVMGITKNRFHMEINKQECLAEIAYTVFHEMKHVEQLVNKVLVYTHANILWKGEDHSATEYMKRPWEVEAYKFERNADLMLKRIGA